MSSEGHLTGSCACGSIQIECHGNPVFFFLCHCVDCRKATGSAYAPNIWFSRDTVSITNEPAAHIEKGMSGQETRHEFCPKCGTQIGMCTDMAAGLRAFRASVFNDLKGLQPVANIWISTRLPWEKLDASIASFETQPTTEEFGELLSQRETQQKLQLKG